MIDTPPSLTAAILPKGLKRVCAVHVLPSSGGEIMCFLFAFFLRVS